MLHEILLSLSGVPTPLWDQVAKGTDDEDGGLQSYVSDPERAMLASLSELYQINTDLRDATATISTTHPSMICRAISTAITMQHLAALQKKIVDVESSILNNDAQYVGAYNIVPLSTIVTEFTPWLRRWRWLLKITKFMQGSENGGGCSSAQILDFLDKERHTGYLDIEESSVQLVAVGQQAWMRALTPWIFHGKLSCVNPEDFMVRMLDTEPILERSLIPKFVTDDAAHTILSIGKALNQLHSIARTQNSRSSSGETANQLLPNSLKCVKDLKYPLRPSDLEQAMFAINLSISQQALSWLVPHHMILELLVIIQDYFLLRNGEFALALVNHAEDRIRSRSNAPQLERHVRKLGRLNDLSITETELTTIMIKTWAELSALQPEHEIENAAFQQARSWLSLKKTHRTTPTVSTFLPVSTILDLTLPEESPLHIFFRPSELTLCSNINAYLISIRRAESRMSGLWKMTSLRRCHPTPMGPPRSASKFGQQLLAARRRRENARCLSTRRFWASVRKTLFVLTELDAYFHAEVIEKNWQHFKRWLDAQANGRPQSVNSISRPATATSRQGLQRSANETAEEFKTSNPVTTSSGDPRVLALAHNLCLENIAIGLLLRHETYVEVLSDLLLKLDHFVALFERLQAIWQGLDLQEDDGIMDAFSNYAQEEKEVISEMTRTSDGVEKLLSQFVGNLKTIERDRGLADLTTGVATVRVSGSDASFVPWKVRTLDRLIMKLDFLSVESESDEDLVDEYHDAAS